jgi:hypothetical protein
LILDSMPKVEPMLGRYRRYRVHNLERNLLAQGGDSVELLGFIVPIAIVGGIAYALIELIGRRSRNQDPSGSEILHEGGQPYRGSATWESARPQSRAS